MRRRDTLEYHELPTPGKIAIVPTKPCETQRDLSLAYTPGVAVPCNEIAARPDDVFRYTSKGNLVAVVTNGTAVLGLGNIGPLAAKPVMEGKGVLFKKFADIDVFDLELDTLDPEEIIRTVQILAPTFGGINLEDIKAPECFYIEEKLKATTDIPVFHDDQHGTAIITAAAFLNALEIVGKAIGEVAVVFSGAGAAAISCAKLLVHLGVARENLTMCDSRGVIYVGREAGMNPYKELFAQETDKRTLAEALVGADAFVGVSVAGLVKPEMVVSMADQPIIFALANPDPEILPEAALAARDDVIMATGRSDYPNQVNNVLGFPFIFRGALDVRATEINEEMKVAAVHALANLAKEAVPEQVFRAYKGEQFSFGRDYLIPKPFDQRVLLWVAPAVAEAAMSSGVARQPLDDLDQYRSQLSKIIEPSWDFLRPLYALARHDPKRIVFPEAYEPQIIKAAEICVDEGIAQPILLGNPTIIKQVAETRQIDLTGIEVVDIDMSSLRAEFIERLFERRARKGMTRKRAEEMLYRRTPFGIMMVESGHADGLVGGLTKSYREIIRPALQMCGVRGGHTKAFGAYVVIHGRELMFFADTTVNIEPDAETLAEVAIHTADLASSFGIEPRVAMLSFSNFGTTPHPICYRVRDATELVKSRRPDLMIDGEVQLDPALDPELMARRYPFSTLKERANVFVFPDLTSGNLGYKLMGRLGGATLVGPILVGIGKPISVLAVDESTRGIVNMATITVARAQEFI